MSVFEETLQWQDDRLRCNFDAGKQCDKRKEAGTDLEYQGNCDWKNMKNTRVEDSRSTHKQFQPV